MRGCDSLIVEACRFYIVCLASWMIISSKSATQQDVDRWSAFAADGAQPACVRARALTTHAWLEMQRQNLGVATQAHRKLVRFWGKASAAERAVKVLIEAGHSKDLDWVWQPASEQIAPLVSLSEDILACSARRVRPPGGGPRPSSASRFEMTQVAFDWPLYVPEDDASERRRADVAIMEHSAQCARCRTLPRDAPGGKLSQCTRCKCASVRFIVPVLLVTPVCTAWCCVHGTAASRALSDLGLHAHWQHAKCAMHTARRPLLTIVHLVQAAVVLQRWLPESSLEGYTQGAMPCTR